MSPQIGHVHLKVSNLEQSIQFYEGLLGMTLTQRLGSQAAFLSWGGYHHHIGLNTWHSQGGQPPAPGTTGLFHVAILYPEQQNLRAAVRKLQENGVHFEGSADHGVSEAYYLRDPDGNGIELYWDRPKEAWPRDSEGRLQMVTKPIRP